MSASQSDQVNSVGVAIIAVFGIAIVNAAAVFLILRAVSDPTAFLVASIMVTLASILVDITVIRLALAARRRRARAARRARDREPSASRSAGQ